MEFYELVIPYQYHRCSQCDFRAHGFNLGGDGLSYAYQTFKDDWRELIGVYGREQRRLCGFTDRIDRVSHYLRHQLMLYHLDSLVGGPDTTKLPLLAYRRYHVTNLQLVVDAGSLAELLAWCPALNTGRWKLYLVALFAVGVWPDNPAAGLGWIREVVAGDQYAIAYTLYQDSRRDSRRDTRFFPGPAYDSGEASSTDSLNSYFRMRAEWTSIVHRYCAGPFALSEDVGGGIAYDTVALYLSGHLQRHHTPDALPNLELQRALDVRRSKAIKAVWSDTDEVELVDRLRRQYPKLFASGTGWDLFFLTNQLVDMWTELPRTPHYELFRIELVKWMRRFEPICTMMVDVTRFIQQQQQQQQKRHPQQQTEPAQQTQSVTNLLKQHRRPQKSQPPQQTQSLQQMQKLQQTQKIQQQLHSLQQQKPQQYQYYQNQQQPQQPQLQQSPVFQQQQQQQYQYYQNQQKQQQQLQQSQHQVFQQQQQQQQTVQSWHQPQQYQPSHPCPYQQTSLPQPHQQPPRPQPRQQEPQPPQRQRRQSLHKAQQPEHDAQMQPPSLPPRPQPRLPSRQRSSSGNRGTTPAVHVKFSSRIKISP